MKFTLFSTLALVSCILSTPISAKDIVSRGNVKLGSLKLPGFVTPRIGVTVVKKGKSSSSSRVRRATTNYGLATAMEHVAEDIKDRCNDIGVYLEDAKQGTVSGYQAAQNGVKMMNNIRAVLFGTISGLESTPKTVLTQEERQQLIDHLYTITSKFYGTTKDYIETLGGSSGGRSFSRAAHMLSDMLESVVFIDPSVVPDMSNKLSSIFPAGLGENDDNLIDLIMNPVTSYLTSVKTGQGYDSVTTQCAGPDTSCYSGLKEELK
ncbi:hypothetical protein FHETE_7463 [Fusarium heterosporum]|uniref:Uncharacterized protein n=1 Tax=Fusarium heterosporum TaxID=42747 RepID=A0A8H5T5W7_FUSHE|nr:hypothetical protein FHETE_7463 [Fusarium heterosporum]